MRTRATPAIALLGLGPPSLLAAQVPHPAELEVLEAAAELPAAAVPGLCAALGSADAGTRLRAFVVLLRHAERTDLRPPLGEAMACGGEARLLATLLLARQPKVELPLPPGYQWLQPRPAAPVPPFDPATATLDELIACCREASPALPAAASELARRASLDPAAVWAFIAAVERSPVAKRRDVLHAGSQYGGPWVRALFPLLRRYLRTNLCVAVEAFFTQDPQLAAEFAPLLRDEMRGARLEDIAALSWYLAPTPALMAPWADEVAAVIPRASSHQRVLILQGFTALDRASPACLDALRSCAADTAPQVRARALALAARWRLDDEALLAAARAAAADSALEVRAAAALVLQRVAPVLDAAALRDALSVERADQLVAALQLLHEHAAAPPAELFATVRAVLQRHEPELVSAATLALARFGPPGRDAILGAQPWLRVSLPPLREQVLQCVAGLGPAGFEALSLLLDRTDMGSSACAVLDRLGERALPAWLAFAQRAVRFGVPSPERSKLAAGVGALGKAALTDPAQLLLDHADALTLAERAALLRDAARSLVQRQLRDAQGRPLADDERRRVALGLLGHRQREVADYAAGIVQALQPVALTPLRERWLAASPDERALCGVLLRRLDPAVQRLPLPLWLARQRLEHRSALLQEDAILALARAGCAGEASASIARALDRDPSLARPLLAALPRSPDPRVVALLEELCAHADGTVREQAARTALALGPAADSAAVHAWQHAEARSGLLHACRSVGRIPFALVADIARLAATDGVALQEPALALLLDSRVDYGTVPELRAAFALAWSKATTVSERAALLPRLGMLEPATQGWLDSVKSLLTDARAEVRWAALEALAATRPEPALAKQWREEVRAAGAPIPAAAWRVLAGWHGALPADAKELVLLHLRQTPITTILPVLRRVMPLLGEAERQAVAAVVLDSALPTDGAGLRHGAEVLGGLGAPALARWAATREPVVLEELARQSPGMLLAAFEQTSTPQLLRALGASSDRDLVHGIRPWLAHESLAIRCAAAAAMRCGGDAAAVDEVLAWAEREGCSAAVVQSLSSFGRAGAPFVPWLQRELLELSPAEQAPAVARLAAFDLAGVAALSSLAAAGVDVEGGLRMVLAHQDAAVSEAGLRLVLELRRPELLPAADAASDARPPRWRAWRTLVEVELRRDEPGRLQDLALALGAEEPLLRRRALDAITRFELDEIGWGLVVEALEDPAPSVRRAAALALAHAKTLRDRLAPVAAEMLTRETDAGVRAALEALR